jgi:SNF2 family DNA or RNA helicase
VDPDEEEEEETADSDILVENTTLYANDDWEDDAYLERTQNMVPEDLATTETTYGTAMNSKSFNKLYEYQREGVQWMFDLYQEGVGGILGDEMGGFM